MPTKPTPEASSLEPRTFAIVIPAYNESRTIRDIAQRALKYSSYVIIVDDGSTDDTAEKVRDLPVTLLQNQPNQGKAAAMWRGMEAAVKNGAEWVITIDADGQHRPEDIPLFLDAAAAHPDTIIIGSRLHDRETIPAKRYWANRFANFWIAWAAGQPVSDSQSGFRLYPAGFLELIDLDTSKEKGFVFESEILIEAGWRSYGNLSVKIPAIYDENLRESHFRSVKDIQLITHMVARRLWQRHMYLPGLYRGVIAPALHKHQRRGLDKDGFFTLALSLLGIWLGRGLTYAWQLYRITTTARQTPASAYLPAFIVVPGHRLQNSAISEDYRQRLDRAVMLFHDGARIIVTGAAADNEPSEAEAGRAHLIRQGIPADAVQAEEHSTNTLGNLMHAREMLPPDATMTLVSNRYHLQRLKIMAQGMNIPVELCAAENQWLARENLPALLWEAFFTHWYWAGRLFSRLTGHQRMLQRIT